MPVEAVKCLHLSGSTYVLDSRSELWWTRDFSPHGAVFKTFTDTGRFLDWEADRNAVGSVINKHKGPVLRKIEKSSMGSCNHPKSHID